MEPISDSQGLCFVVRNPKGRIQWRSVNVRKGDCIQFFLVNYSAQLSKMSIDTWVAAEAKGYTCEATILSSDPVRQAKMTSRGG